MASRSNDKVKARQRALAALAEQEQARMEAIASAVVDVGEAHAELTRLEAEAAAARERFARATQAGLALGKSVEELAELAGVPADQFPSSRAARSAKRSPAPEPGAGDGWEPDAAEGGMRAVSPPPVPPVTRVPGEDGEEVA